MNRKNRYKIVFIGSGNVATHLANAFKSAGQEVLQVYSKTLSNAKKLALVLKSEYTDDLNQLRSSADIYFIAIKDNAIGEIAQKLNLKNKIVVHTSGSVGMEILKNVSENFGVFYPMQTFSKQRKINLSNTAIFIEASKKTNEKTLMQIGNSISKNIHVMNSKQRKIVHLAAVFANNFTNHFYTIAEEILKKNNLSFDILKPLILETSEKILKDSPSNMQTGPAKRGDKKIIAEHLKMLDSFPGHKKIYALISKSIMKKYSG